MTQDEALWAISLLGPGWHTARAIRDAVGSADLGGSWSNAINATVAAGRVLRRPYRGPAGGPSTRWEYALA